MALEQGHLVAPRQAPGRHQPGDAATDHGNVHVAGLPAR
jgi:hypothetical protein